MPKESSKITIKNAFIAVLLVSFLASCTTTDDKAVIKTIKTQKSTEPNLKEAAELNTQLAIGYIQRQQYKPAKDKLEKSIEQNPDYLPAYKTLAYLYALLGQPEQAHEQ